MKALTVQQPWAWAIVHGGKNVVNLSQAWSSTRGPLAIHADVRWSDQGGRSGLVWSALKDRYGWPVGPVSARDDRRPGFDTIRPLGAFIGVVDMVGAHGASEDCCDSPWGEREYVEVPRLGDRPEDIERICGTVHLEVANPRPLTKPIPYPGQLEVWTLEHNVVDQINQTIRTTKRHACARPSP